MDEVVAALTNENEQLKAEVEALQKQCQALANESFALSEQVKSLGGTPVNANA